MQDIFHSALKVERAPKEHFELINSMLRDYLLELGASTDYPYLPFYWQEECRHPYLFSLETRIVGFALVREFDDSVWEMAEFCVRPALRRSGIGRIAARHIFSAHPGKWVVNSYPGNKVAEAFWREVLRECN